MAAISLADFTIKKKLGEGSYSTVNLAYRKQDKKEYALKQVNIARLNEKERVNALNEVRFLASIKHKNVIGYRAAFVDEQSQTLCIVMEYANDGDLLWKIQDLRKKGQLMQEQEIWSIFIQLAQGLQCLHQMKIMHRDLKPANIFLWKSTNGQQQLETEEGVHLVAKIGDMNVSKLAQNNGLNYTQTGTPYYASPEVWRDQPYDFKSDVWSLGCILYEMTTLRPPFQATDMDQLFKKVIKGQVPKIPSAYSPELGALIRSMLTVDSAQRPSINNVLSLPTVLQKIEYIQLEPLPTKQRVNNSSTLLQTIRDSKDLRTLKRLLPAPAFQDLKQIDDNIETENSMQNGNRLSQANELKLRELSANQKSSMSLLAKNQSQKVLHSQLQSQLQTNRRQQLHILPLLSKNKEKHEKLLQRIRDSSQLLLNQSKYQASQQSYKMQSSKNTLSRNKAEFSYHSNTHEPCQENDSSRVSLSNSKLLNISQQNRSQNIIARTRSEQKLINLNTPMGNVLPQLGIVLETSNSKMNLKSLNKSIQKPTLNQTKHGYSQSPQRQYGAQTSANSEQTSLNNSLVK